jgi:8-oxo-dGTP diphosphatase
MALLLVRHASAGSRDEWAGDDRERPLDKRGARQAKDLVGALADVEIDRVLTSPYLRCVQSVEPFAAARGLSAEVCEELSEEEQHTAGIQLVRGLAGSGVLVCGHGGLEHAIPDPPRWKKGMILIVGERLELVEVRRV